MATQAHCAFCFETLDASLSRRQPLTLPQVETLWAEYCAGREDETVHELENDGDRDETEMTYASAGEPTAARPAAISRLLNRMGGGSLETDMASSRSSTPSSSQSGNNETSGSATPVSSKSSMSSNSSPNPPVARGRQVEGKFPLFVTWNTLDRDGHKSLRGCIGTFQEQDLEHGLSSYALTSAFEDTRFQPIPAFLLPSLSNHVTLLTNFSIPTNDPLAWTLGKHGIRISFTNHGRRYGSTYLPDVAVEQEWTKEEAVISLMRKAGWNGSSSSWQKTWRDGRGELITYEGKQVGLRYSEWHEWREWVYKQDGERSR